MSALGIDRFDGSLVEAALKDRDIDITGFCIFGTQGRDVILGSSLGDVIYGSDGN